MRLFRLSLLVFFAFITKTSFGQQDMDLHVSDKYFAGKNILKVRRDFYDPYLWVLAQNNKVYRINSITHDWKDYTAKFSAYSSYNFIDIAGVSMDTVFVVTQSSDIIEYKKGDFKVIGTADGIQGNLTGVGINPSSIGNSFFFTDLEMAAFSTDKGLFRYNYKTEVLTPALIEKQGRIFESSYRTMVFQGTNMCRCYADPEIDKRDLVSLINQILYGGDIYLGKDFGNNITSAYSTPWNAFVGFGWGNGLANQFWATEKGLFQNYFDYSSEPENGYKHYLEGKNITKITGIYGLVNFGDPYGVRDIVKENLLIGTSKGLYFSNSQHGNLSGADYTFFHFDGLGEKIINDINVNANSYNYTQKNIWLNYGNICEDGAWVAADDGLYFLTRDYKPYIDPNYRLQAINIEGYPFASKEIEICKNVSVKARINFVQYNNLNFKWYKNGQLIQGEISNNLDINSAGDYYAILEDPCSNISLETYHVKVNVAAAPKITFNYPDQITQCQGTIATFQVDNNANYSYRWYKDGALNGNNTPQLSTTQSGKYKLEVSSCPGTWVSTKEVEINFISVPQPDLKANKAAYCVGEPATLSTSFVNDGTYTINWLRDGNLLSAQQNKTTITTTQAGSYVIRLSSNLLTCDNTSAALPLNFEATPTIRLERIVTTTLCDGQSVDLKATYSGGTVKWSTGASADNISVNQSGIYTATVKTAAGCEVSENIAVQFAPNPTLNLSDATLCQFINEKITLTAPAGFVKYEWNGEAGGADFSTNKLGKINLKVTDNNGCTATQTINITSQCDEVHIPNTFTPNSDGINDTWKIEGLEGDASITVKVFNRLGTLIYQSVGYDTPWDGTFNGKKIPSGTYYYILSAKKGGQLLTGSVTLIN